MSQRAFYLIGSIIMMLGVGVLGADQLTVSADTVSNFGQKITVYTIIGLFLLLVAVCWFFFVSYQQKDK